MSRRRTATGSGPRLPFELSELGYEAIGLILMAFGFLLLLGWAGAEVGWIISETNRLISLALGKTYPLISFLVLVSGAVLFLWKDESLLPYLFYGALPVIWASATALNLWVNPNSGWDPVSLMESGGWIGHLTASLLSAGFGRIGASVVLVTATIVGFLYATRKPLTEAAANLGRWVSSGIGKIRAWMIHRKESRQQRQVPLTATAAPVSVADRELRNGKEEEKKKEEKTEAPKEGRNTKPRVEETDYPFPMESLVSPSVSRKERKVSRWLPSDHYEKVIAVLEPPRPEDNPETTTSLEEGIRLVEETLASFKIDAKVVNVKRGPVVSRYEVAIAPGIRVRRIENLADDLALALAAIDVRVEAPVPGKSVIGIEVPNRRIALVRLRELLELPEFRSAPSKLTFALGKDIAGVPRLADLSKMPHILIGGATNGGKSVCLNALIISLLARAHPNEVRLSLIDPKRVELTLFNGIPHLIHPVVVEPQQALAALKCAIREMERRYRLLAEKGVRNLDSYNSLVAQTDESLREPHIVIVIDELADLMMQVGAELERLICRIAQLARATGIHLVIATQRPSVNVITGLIKANIPSRIAFAVASQTDSRVILDANGAERLIGRGDMLFHPIDAPKPIRIQGAFVSEEEVHRVAQVLINEYGEPDEYLFDLSVDEEREPVSERPEKRDPLFDRAVEVIQRKGYASASLLQRELEIGYPRAGKLIDQLEKAGIIGPAEGNKPRKVLIPFLDPERLLQKTDGQRDSEEFSG
ncbi:MAG: DNA translocase FtsK [Armatimonadetes bacterium]|nr:DNA translocase FtsK [Armatimonadota bacterium]MDW8120797.1 DNA translocase FtsK [Armatimonadota bacterium]